jgi:hypothetical protein
MALSAFIKGATGDPGIVAVIGPATSSESVVVSAASSVDLFQYDPQSLTLILVLRETLIDSLTHSLSVSL